MKYVVKMKNVGRNKSTEEQEFDSAPGYNELYGMAMKHLASSGIDFDTKAEGFPILDGKIYVGGFRHVGDFTVEEKAG